ncbi:hypothetical protein [Chitinophaga polysaccharea]|uniref:hypothetical protein n=1 Tax=Chitinophaga polysaccharea TaxID=1293035 RepID=UPI00115AFA20|nr:hypothetical protein [Chitinophaga polysaccharea]
MKDNYRIRSAFSLQGVTWSFDNPTHQLSILSFTFIAQKNGKVNPELAKGSSINIIGTTERNVSFK